LTDALEILDQEVIMQISIAEQEKTLLIKIVEDYLGTLREEIHRTDSFTAKAGLKDEEVLIKSILEGLRSAK
jgi:hypothetical protein